VGHGEAFRWGANSIVFRDALNSSRFSQIFSLRNIQIIQSLELQEQGFCAVPNSLCLPCPRASFFSAAIPPHISKFFSSEKIPGDSTA